MEQMLLKLARQLDAMDEASLMGLWEKYANIVNQFEPSQRWQEAVLVLSFIQAKRWKNQLFNTQWAARTRGGIPAEPLMDGLFPSQQGFSLEPDDEKRPQSGKRAKILFFSPSEHVDAAEVPSEQHADHAPESISEHTEDTPPRD